MLGLSNPAASKISTTSSETTAEPMIWRIASSLSSSLRFFRAAGVPPWREFEAECGIIGTPVVDASARFVRPASYGDVLDVDTYVAQWRGKSFVMSHIIRRGEAVLVEGQVVRVFARRHPADPHRIQAVEVPERVRAWCGS